MNINDYQQQAMRTCMPASKNLPYMALGLAGEAGEVANKVKKVIRDSDGVLKELQREQLIAELGDVLWYCAGVATVLGANLDYVAAANVNKLQARQSSGTLGGQGDER